MCVFSWRGHSSSHDKDGGHSSIRSAMAENTMLHANFSVLSSIEPDLLQIEVLHSRNRDFRDFLLPMWLWHWPDDLHI